MYYSVFFITQNRLGQIFQDYKLQFLLPSSRLKAVIKRLTREMPSSSDKARTVMHRSTWPFAPIIYIHGNVDKGRTAEKPVAPVACAGGIEANLSFFFFFFHFLCATVVNDESILISPLASIVVTVSR